MKRPILIALIGYIIGIIWELYLKINIAPLVITLIMICILDKKYKKVITIVVISIIIGNIQTKYLNNKFKKLYSEIPSNSQFIGVVISDKKEGNYYNTYTIKILEINKSNKYRNTKLYIRTTKELSYGKKIKFNATYIKADIRRNYLGFDYSEYLKTIGIYGICENVNINEVSKTQALNKIDIITHKITVSIKEKVRSILDEDKAGLLIALTTGDNSLIDEEIKESFRNSGLYHILAISGMHMAYIILFLEKTTNKIDINKNRKKVFQIVGIIFFIQITTKSISILRAGIMAIIAIFATIVRRKSDSINNISISMLILLIINPYSIKNISFQLSFGGVIGIVLLNKYYQRLLDKFKIYKSIKEILSTILSAQTIIIPIIILNFHTISLTFFISNLLVGYIIGIVIILGFLIIGISFISLDFAKFISLPLDISIKILISMTDFCSKLPLSRIYVTRPPIYIILIYYILILKLTIFKDMYNNEIKKIFKFLKKKEIYILVISAITIFTYTMIPKNLKIYFIDVGQGDSTLIITPQNKKILIDSGGNSNKNNYDIGEDTLLPYLLNRGIKRLDYVIVSHFDTDHVRRTTINNG